MTQITCLFFINIVGKGKTSMILIVT